MRKEQDPKKVAELIVSRRQFVGTSMTFSLGAKGILSFGFALPSTLSEASDSLVKEVAFAPNLWLKFYPEGKTVFILDRAEMGQGVATSLPVIIAEELDIDPETLEVEYAKADRKYGNPEVMGIQITGGSTSVKGAFGRLREAGALVRGIFIDAASAKWNVPSQEITVENGIVKHSGKNLSAAFHSLLVEAAKTSPRKISDLVLKSSDNFKYIGKNVNPRDLLAKVQGKFDYGIDQKKSNMLIAIVIRPPAAGMRCRSFDAAAALAMNGVKKIGAVPSGVAIVARTYWHARKAVEALNVKWEGNSSLPATQQEIDFGFSDAVRGSGKTVKSESWKKSAFESVEGELIVSAEYSLPYLAHATMEPQNCTVLCDDHACEVWAPTQSAGLAFEAVRRVTGFSKSAITVHTVPMGGGFGRRLYQDFVAEGVTVAQLVPGVPVKVIWSREDDMNHDYYRPAARHFVRAKLSSSKRIAAYEHKIVAPALLTHALPEWIPGLLPAFLPPSLSKSIGQLSGNAFASGLAPDDTSFEGIPQIPYATESLRVESVQCDPGIPTGFWRSVGHSHTAFAVESFVDELAEAAKQDPLAFRLSLLPQDSTYRRTLELVAKMCSWNAEKGGQALGANVFRGIAVHECFGSCVAAVTEIEWKGPNRELSEESFLIKNVFAAIECGQAVQPDTVKAQVEGGILFGLSAAMFGKSTFKDGKVEQDNFDTYRLLRMNQAPNVHVGIVPSAHSPKGVGEPGVPPAAPSLVNAIFRATGKRMRTLPLF